MNNMKKINFLITNALLQQIEEAMSQLGINSKAEFFRMLALNCAKEVNAQRKNSAPPKIDRSLSKDEKMILLGLEEGPKRVDDLVEETGIPAGRVAGLLIELLVKKRVAEAGHEWIINNHHDINIV